MKDQKVTNLKESKDEGWEIIRMATKGGENIRLETALCNQVANKGNSEKENDYDDLLI